MQDSSIIYLSSLKYSLVSTTHMPSMMYHHSKRPIILPSEHLNTIQRDPSSNHLSILKRYKVSVHTTQQLSVTKLTSITISSCLKRQISILALYSWYPSHLRFNIKVAGCVYSYSGLTQHGVISQGLLDLIGHRIPCNISRASILELYPQLGSSSRSNIFEWSLNSYTSWRSILAGIS